MKMVTQAKLRITYALSDFLSASLAWFIFNLIRFFTLPYNYNSMSLQTYMSMDIVVLGQCLFPLMMVLLYAISGYYNSVIFKSRLDDVLNCAAVSAIGTLIIFFTVLFNDIIDDRLGNFEMIAILWGLLFIIGILPRLAITANITNKIANRVLALNAIIVGNGAKAHSLAAELETKHRQMGFKVVGYAIDSEEKPESEGVDLPVYSIQEVVAKQHELDISAFIIVPEEQSTDSLIATINRLLPLGKAVYMRPDSYHFIANRPRTAMIAGKVLIDVSRAAIPASTINLKRISDVIISSIALLALSPLLGIISVVVKKDSKGPVIYSQERIGYKKKPFKIYKFRTMRTDAESQGPALSAVDDPRITKVGRVLRKYRMDELPQFWNVLKGDMSLVGPRPERQYYLDQIIKRAPYYNIVHQVRPGITSWGMVKYGYASTVEQMLERMKYDLLYVDNVSMSVDLKILFYTVRTVLTGKGV